MPILFLLLFVSVSYSQFTIGGTAPNPVTWNCSDERGCNFYDGATFVCDVYGLNLRGSYAPDGLGATIRIIAALPSNPPVGFNGCTLSMFGSVGGYSVANTCVNSSSCSAHVTTSNKYFGSVSWNVSCFLTCPCSSPDCNPLPQCSEFLPVSAPACKGGQGLSLTGNLFYLQGVISAAFPNATEEPPVPGVYWFPSNPNSTSDTLTRPDGSQCNYFNQGAGAIYDVTVCPLGFEETCEENPNRPQCQSSSSSLVGSSSSQCAIEIDGICVDKPDENCKVMIDGVCVDKPDENCKVMINGICVDKPDTDSCKIMIDGRCILTNNEGDWAKEGIQIAELNTAIEIRDKVQGLLELAQAGYNLSKEQTDFLDGIGDGIDEIKGFLGDTSGSGSFNFSGSSLDSLFSSGGDGGGQMIDSLGNGSGARAKIKKAVGIDSASFAFFGTGSQCPVYDVSFSSGEMGIGCSGSGCRIDLCNIYGFNMGVLLKSILWLAVLLGTLFYDLEILRKGGH